MKIHIASQYSHAKIAFYHDRSILVVVLCFSFRLSSKSFGLSPNRSLSFGRFKSRNEHLLGAIYIEAFSTQFLAQRSYTRSRDQFVA